MFPDVRAKCLTLSPKRGPASHLPTCIFEAVTTAARTLARGRQPRAANPDTVFAAVRSAPVREAHARRGRSDGRMVVLSPRARATPNAVSGRERELRFIPACAGNTLQERQSKCERTVHPRVRGEHSMAPFPRTHSPGSSPRARGTRPRERAEHLGRRFIPACAGNTVSNLTNAGRFGGSSPRARGTRPRLDQRDQVGRFIPACAGNTSINAQVRRYWSVHPRVRGEHTGWPCAPGGSGGSSPRARGTHCRHGL